MLASKYRLSKGADFEEVKEEGKLYQSDSFGVAVLKRNKERDSRFGFVVSTKISKHAFQRNRIKRALRESVRHHLHIIGKGYDMVFLAKKGVTRRTTEEIMKEVKIFIVEKLER